MINSESCYEKALNYYENGYIEKAIELCEKGISFDIKNKAVIDLKGILYYLKGDLESAQSLWKLNAQMNNDRAAKVYLETIDDDEENLSLFLEAVKLVKEIKINEAVELLEKCEESDFNAINVNNYLCICYMKQCKFEEAKEKLDKVLKLDKKNQLALNNRKQLIEYNIVEKKINFKLILATIIVISIIAGITFGIINISKYYNNLKVTDSKKASVSNKTKKNAKAAVKTEKPVEKTTAVEEVKFPTATFENILNNKDFEQLYSYVTAWNNKTLEVNDKKLLTDGETLLAEEGTSYFYKTGSAYYKNKDFANAIMELNKAYQNASKSYLYPDITYFLAVSYDNSKNYENAIKYYSLYDASYSSGSYEETVLYNLATIYKAIDIEKAKQYANRLLDKFPNSMYNNSNMKEILGN